MLIELLCIAAVYAGGALYVRWVARHRSQSLKEQLRYVLVAGNHEAQIEWYLRGLRRYSRRSGKEVLVTVWLRDSSDETGSIVRQIARGDDGVVWSDAMAAPVAGFATAGGASDKLGTVAAGSGTDLASEWVDAGLYADERVPGMYANADGGWAAHGANADGWTAHDANMGGEWKAQGANSGGRWTDARLETTQPIWVELSKPEDVARLPI